MSVFEAAEYDDHEQVVFVRERSVGLRAIIAIHDTTLGPALGGVRMYPYANESDAVRDVLRLSRGMTYKAAVLDCGLGGGKSVVIGDPYSHKTPELMHAVGRAIQRLGERYICGEDIGTNPFDMREIREETRCVSCLREEDGGYGDPAPYTALGVFSAIRAGLEYHRGRPDLNGVTAAVQGVGNVGANLCRLLRDAGAELIICDVNAENLKAAADAYGAKVVGPDDIYDVQADVFAPCAMGATLNDDTIPRLSVDVIAGAANNQLDEERHAVTIAERGITYLPDYVANGGGLVSCAAEWYRTDIDEVPHQVRNIFETCVSILNRADEQGVTTTEAASEIAEERIRSAGGLDEEGG